MIRAATPDDAPTIAFYDAAGADSLDEGTVRRVSGDALAKLAGRG